MDCREFRKQHFAYLDDTLPGDTMAEAQRHVMACDNCAAHDSMVRRSLMLVRNMSVIEPSAAFRQRMQARLNETRAEVRAEMLQSGVAKGTDARLTAAARSNDLPPGPARTMLRLVNLESEVGVHAPRVTPSLSRANTRTGSRQPILFSVAAASVLMVGTIVWLQPSTNAAPETVAISVAPVTVTQPAMDTTLQPIYISPAMVQAMSTGNPMWPAALILDDTPGQLVNSEMTMVKAIRE